MHVGIQKFLPRHNVFFVISSFVLYVNGQSQITDVTANDDKWHHLAVTWSSAGGHWKIFKDGQQEDQGMLLANGTLMEGQFQCCTALPSPPPVAIPHDTEIGSLSSPPICWLLQAAITYTW